jgi:B9 domain-containing protein 2
MGEHTIEIVTWRPKGTFVEEWTAWFLGGTPQLKNSDIVSSSADRTKLKTITMGKVQLNLAVMFKDVEKYGLKW